MPAAQALPGLFGMWISKLEQVAWILFLSFSLILEATRKIMTVFFGGRIQFHMSPYLQRDSTSQRSNSQPPIKQLCPHLAHPPVSPASVAWALKHSTCCKQAGVIGLQLWDLDAACVSQEKHRVLVYLTWEDRVIKTFCPSSWLPSKNKPGTIE